MPLMPLLLALLALQDVDGLLHSLEDEKLEARERAASGLLERWASWTDADLEQLRRAAASPQAETSARAGDLLRRIGLRRKLGPNAFRRLPKADTILMTGTGAERKELLYEVHRLWRLGDLESPEARTVAELVGEDGWGLVGESTVGQDRIIRPFIPVLRTGLKDPGRRAEAIDFLSLLDAREVIAEVTPMLRDDDPAVRVAAADALVGWGIRVDPAPVVKLLQGTPRTVRDQAMQVLQKMKDPSTVDAVAAMLVDPEEGMRSRAVNALGAIGAKSRASDVVTRLTDESATVRISALRVLTAWKCREHAGAILGLLNDRVAGVVHAAEDAVRALGARELADKLLPLVTSAEWGTRHAAWTLLSEAGDPRAKLLEALKHPEWDVRESAVHFLGKGRTKEDGRLFLGLLRDPSAEVRRAALEKLSDRAYSDHLAAVAACLDDSDPSVRGFAATALVRMGDTSKADRMAELMSGSDEWQVDRATHALGWMADRKYAKTLADLLRKKPATGMETLISALGRMGAREEAKTIADLLDQQSFTHSSEVLEALWLLASDQLDGCVDRVLQSGEERGRHAALKILGSMGTAEAVKRLETQLEAPDRAEGARALLATGLTDAFEKAVRLLADQDYLVRGSAAWALAGWASTGQAPPDLARLKRMLERLDEDRVENARDASLVVQVGLKLRDPAEIRPLLEKYDLPQIDQVLASVRARESFLKLQRRFELKEDLRSAEDLRRVLEGCVDIDAELVLLGCVRKGLRATGLEFLDLLTPRTDLNESAFPRVGFIVDNGVLRAVPGDQAMAFWRRQLGSM